MSGLAPRARRQLPPEVAGRIRMGGFEYYGAVGVVYTAERRSRRPPPPAMEVLSMGSRGGGCSGGLGNKPGMAVQRLRCLVLWLWGFWGNCRSRVSGRIPLGGLWGTAAVGFLGDYRWGVSGGLPLRGFWATTAKGFLGDYSWEISGGLP